MRYEDYLESGDLDDNTVKRYCNVCGADYGKMYHFEGEDWCEDCLENNYYYCNNDDETDEEMFCACCGEPIHGRVYNVPDGNGEDVYYCTECFFDAAEFGSCMQ